MSQERVARLEGLLARVQDNRKKPRIAAAKPEVSKALAAEPPKAAPAPAPTAAPEPVRPAAVESPRAFGRPPVQQPAAAAPRSVSPPAAPPKPAAPPVPARPPLAAQPPAARAPALPEAPAARKPGQDRTATPLEMAVAELDLAGAPKQQPLAKEPLKHVETTPGQLAPTTPLPDVAPTVEEEESIEARVIEPEPMREPARPIAQMVSRHSPQVDATFGAMLKRSLSLRPH